MAEPELGQGFTLTTNQASLLRTAYDSPRIKTMPPRAVEELASTLDAGILSGDESQTIPESLRPTARRVGLVLLHREFSHVLGLLESGQDEQYAERVGSEFGLQGTIDLVNTIIGTQVKTVPVSV